MDGDLILYDSARSTCSLRVRLALAAKGLRFTERALRLDRDEQLSPEYLALNPNGLVPTLLHGGNVVVESSVINEYLDDVFPEQPLRPGDALVRATMRTWVTYFDEVMMPAVRYLSFQHFYLAQIQSRSAQARRRFADTLPLRKGFWLEMGDNGFTESRLALEQERIDQVLRRMNASLERGQWLAGSSMSLADIAVLPAIVRLEDLGLSDRWKSMSALADWYLRMQHLPAFALAYYAGSRFT
ncbi:glutathione S-transferase family protein [Cupriavidus nantongensis]|uniref:glutathione S-transferase family protein n=1 Tax=Cupriavidus nantongensis TaxID=1796606 RepID=UPI00358ECB3B